MRHGQIAVIDPDQLIADDHDMWMVFADMHTWAEKNEQDEDDPLPVKMKSDTKDKD